MGGNAFPVQAKRLSTFEHTALLNFCVERLKKFFPGGIEVCRYLKNKSSHGDLDLVCAYDGIGYESLKGREEGGSGGCGLEKVVNKGKESGMTKFCEMVCEAVSGIRWLRAGGEICLAVPCRVIGAGEGFYEVDLILSPPPALPFEILTMSYSTSLHLLSLILRTISPSLTIHTSNLVIRHQPYPGLPVIDVSLTHEALDLCNWLGLDYEYWQENQFDNEKEYWSWIVGADQDSLGGKALKKLARRGKKTKSVDEVLRSRSWKNRPEGIVAFLDWLRSDQSPWYEAIPEVSTERVEKSRLEVSKSSRSASTMTPTEIAAASAAASAASMVDPDKPASLDRGAREALDYWEKQDVYDSILAVRRVAAETLHKSQQARIERKLAASEEQDEVETAGTAVVERLGNLHVGETRKKSHPCRI